jgi:putative spermidine/putrescine transport system ATP-binding protein
MSGLVLDRLTKRFGPLVAVEDVSLSIAHGMFVCLLGPSGCGKTTLLRMIAGLEEPSEGRIILDGADITQLDAHQRDFGMVFQSLALFPHLNVGGNIAYPLRIRGAPKSEQAARVDELLSLVHLPGLAGRPVSRLSGGQRQRVAIARALARSPRLFLLDEPLSALDAKLREAMQVELRQLQRRLGITTIVVTHDQREAMTMADLIVVMGKGRILQSGPPIEIYRRPSDAFVAGFVGSTNLLPAKRGNGAAIVPGGSIPGLAIPADFAEAVVSVRPEDVRLVDPAAAAMRGRVSFVRDLGATVETYVACGDHEIVAISTPRERPDLREGDEVGLRIDPADCVVLKP